MACYCNKSGYIWCIMTITIIVIREREQGTAAAEVRLTKNVRNLSFLSTSAAAKQNSGAYYDYFKLLIC